MKRIYTLFILIISISLGTFAQQDTLTAERALMACPSSIMPYLTVEQRDQLIHQLKETPQDTAQVSNALDTKSQLLALKDNLFRLKLNESTMMEVALLNGKGELLCLLTNRAPEPETSVKIYTQDWKLKNSVKMKFAPEFFLADTLAAEKRQEALSYIEFPFYSCTISDVEASDVSLNVTLSLPTLTKEEREKISGWFMQRNVKLSKIIAN